jgi:hypothetical protein
LLEDLAPEAMIAERERDWIAERIDGRVDFRRQSATRATDRLVLTVFFWAPALC